MYRRNPMLIFALSCGLFTTACTGVPNQPAPAAVTPITPATLTPAPISTSTALAVLPASTPTPRPSPTPPPATARPATGTPEPELPASTMVATATQAAEQAGSPVEVVITEKELSDALQQALAQQPDSPVSSLELRLVPDQMIFHAKEVLGSETLDLVLGLTLKVQEGKVLPEATELNFGGEEITGPERALALSMLQPMLVDSWVDSWPMDVQEVHIMQGQIRMVGKRK